MQEIYSSNKNYFDLIIKDFGEKTEFCTIKELSNTYLYEIYITLKFIQEILYNKDLYNELKEIRLEKLENEFWGGKEYPRFGCYKTNNRIISLNIRYFGSNVSDNDKAEVKEDTFADTIMHEIGHYVLIKYNKLEKTKKLYNTVEKCRNYFDQFDSDYLRSLSEDERIHELYARAFSKNNRDILYKNNNKNF